jgi:putative transposase
LEIGEKQVQTFKVKLKLNKQQKQQVDTILKENNDLYNIALEIILENYSVISEFDAQKLYQINPEVPSQIAQITCKRAHKSVVRHKFPDLSGKKFGKPRYKITNKTKGESFAFQLNEICRINGMVKQFGRKITIKVPKLGKLIGLSDTRLIEGNVKQVAIKKDCCKDYWATIVTDNKRKITLKPPVTDVIGVHLGLKHTVSASNIDGSVIIQPTRDRILDKNLKSLKFASNKDRKALPFVHRKIARKRKDMNWKLARKIVESANYIYVGDVSPRWLFSGRLARSAADAALGDLKLKMSYLAESAGRHFLEIPEAYTSKTCSCCKKVKSKLKLSDRVFQCSCGFILDRDLNAARNIAEKGWLSSLNGSVLCNTTEEITGTSLVL